jgi:tyrosyl-tRNA synthetase
MNKNFKSSFLQELLNRGFLAQCTNLSGLDEILLSNSIAAYIGFDCTASSLHAGSLIQIMILRLLQKHGHKPVILLGGGTTRIGDPSGKDEARKVLDEEQIKRNSNGIKKSLEQFISFEPLPNQAAALLVNNDDWLKNLNYIDFLRDIGRHFSVNRMLTFDSVKLRLDREQNLSFLEFNYMILQAYDFLELSKKYDCVLQIGGSDQWGNIVNGVELVRKISAQHNQNSNEVFGLTSILLTTADGKKMGKTADGAVWLDKDLLSPYNYFQYFRNVHDADIFKFLKLFTDLSLQDIEKLEKESNDSAINLNKAKEILAFEATKICHGLQEADLALEKAREIFVNRNSTSYQSFEIEKDSRLIEIMVKIAACASNSEAKKLIEGKAVKIDSQIILDAGYLFTKIGQFDLSIGKKKFFKIIIK